MRRTRIVQGETSLERPKRKYKPATTPEGREEQLISMAYDLVEQRLLNGTATSQETTHFLRMGSPSARLERELLNLKKEKTQAEIEAIQSQKRVEELYANALAAMKSYGMHSEEE